MLFRSTRLPSFLRCALLLGLVGLLVAGCGDEPPPPPPPPPADVAVADTTYALLVGCTEYPVLREAYGARAHDASLLLLGPANDARLMHDVLHDYLGVPEANLSVLAGWPDDPKARPTRANILGGLDRLAREVPRGARVIFLFAGHGSWQPDVDGDEPDERDEILMPADVGRWDDEANRVANAITDDELRARFSALRAAGAELFAIFDCCYGGTLLRAPNPMAPRERPTEPPEPVRLREIDQSMLGVPKGVRSRGMAEPGAAEETPGFIPEDTPGVVRERSTVGGAAGIYAARSVEKAAEMVLPRGPRSHGREDHGLCTFHVARALQHFHGGVTVAEILAYVREQYAATPWTKATPQAEGDLSLRVLPGSPLAAAPLLLRRDGEGEDAVLIVEAGRLRGLTVGSVLEVYARGGAGVRAARLGRVRIAQVGPLEALCEALPGGPPLHSLPSGAPARVVELADGPAPLPLAVVDRDGAPLLVDAIDRILREAGLTDPSGVDLAFVPKGQAAWTLIGIEAEGDLERFALAANDGSLEPQVVTLAGLRAALEHIARAHHLRTIAREPAFATLPAGMEVQAFVQRFEGGEPTPLAPGTVAGPGDRIVLRVRNGTNRDVDVAVRYLDAHQRESHVWPEGGEPSRRLGRSDDQTVAIDVPLGDDVLGRESLVVVVAVRERGAAPLNVNAVDVEAVDEPGGEGSRGVDAETPGAVMGVAPEEHPLAVLEFTWRTAWGRLAIPREIAHGLTDLAAPVVTPPYASPHAAQTTWSAARVVLGEAGAADVLVVRGTVGTTGAHVHGLFVDVDRDVELDALPLVEAVRGAATRTLPYDMAVLLGSQGRAALYRRHPGDRLLGRAREGGLAGDRATAGYRFEAELGWREHRAFGPWLSTTYLPEALREDGGAEAVVHALRAFRPPR